VARRTMTLRRIDPWSVLKFGFVINICAAIVFVLGFGILWFVVGQLGIIEQACQLAEDVGFEDCGVDTGALFRVVMLIGGLAAVIMTGLAVFGAFLHNLLADLVGEAIEPITSEEERQYGWRLARLLRYLRHFYEAPEGRLHHTTARDLAIQEGYDPRGVAGFYQGTASLRKKGDFRVLTDAGRQLYEDNRHRLD
jgi:hypothetical protein